MDKRKHSTQDHTLHGRCVRVPLLGRLTREANRIASYEIPTKPKKQGGVVRGNDRQKRNPAQIAKNFLMILQRELMGFFTLANNCRIGFFAMDDGLTDFATTSREAKIVADIIRRKGHEAQCKAIASPKERAGAQNQFDRLYKAMVALWNRMIKDPNFDADKVMKHGIESDKVRR